MKNKMFYIYQNKNLALERRLQTRRDPMTLQSHGILPRKYFSRILKKNFKYFIFLYSAKNTAKLLRRKSTAGTLQNKRLFKK